MINLEREIELAFKSRRIALINGWLEAFNHERGGVALAVWSQWIQDLNDSQCILFKQGISAK